MAPETAFDLFDPRLQAWVHRQGWTKLHEIQELAARPILGGHDVLIAAPTAGGKTEAVFIPLLTRVAEAAAESEAPTILAVCPLKALINDQWNRLQPMADAVGMEAHRWHGDVSGAAKERALRSSGILLITPESIEARLSRQGGTFRESLSGIRAIVIDELHAFIGTERGRHLQSLLHRVEQITSTRPQRIGLSATIGDLAMAGDFMRPGGEVEIIETDAAGSVGLKLQVRGYFDQRGQGAGADDLGSVVERAVAEHMYSTLRGESNLVFANARGNVEVLAALLREQCERERVPNEFFPHHGSLSRELRHQLETRLREGTQPTTAICTSTLELGIDIGAVESVAQYRAPANVASIRQRLGRSGRRGRPAILRVYVPEDRLGPRRSIIDELRTELVQTIAVVDLLLDRWYEPPNAQALHLSTLVHQVLSCVAQQGSLTAKSLYRLLCDAGPFRTVSSLIFAKVLRDMGRTDLLVQMHDQQLVLGLEGERIVNRYDFYAAFNTPEEFRVVAGGRTLGSIPVDFPLTPGMRIVFAGRRWQVTLVDSASRTIDVVRAPGGQPPRFGGGGGTVHTEVRSRMLRAYANSGEVRYLDGNAQELLSQGQAAFAAYGLGADRLVDVGADTYVFPWCGDRALATLTLALRATGHEASVEGPSIRVEGVTRNAVDSSLRTLRSGGPMDALELAARLERVDTEKFYWVLSDDLYSIEVSASQLDPAGAWEALADFAD